MSYQRSTCLVGALLLLFISPSLSADTVVLTDDFSSGNFYFGSSFNNSDGGGANEYDYSGAYHEINSSGGNPDDSMTLTHYHDVERDENTGNPVSENGATSVFSFLHNDDVKYNPATEGAFETVNFSFQYKTNDTDFNTAFAHILNGSGSGQFAGVGTEVVTDNTWHTFSQTFNNEDFFLMDFSGTTSTSLEFGFGFASELDVTGSTGETLMNVQIDNFIVSVSAVPEPTSLAALGFVGLIVAVRRRK